MQKAGERGLDWAGLPVLLAFAILFWAASVHLHRRSMSRRIWA